MAVRRFFPARSTRGMCTHFRVEKEVFRVIGHVTRRTITSTTPRGRVHSSSASLINQITVHGRPLCRFTRNVLIDARTRVRAGLWHTGRPGAPSEARHSNVTPWRRVMARSRDSTRALFSDRRLRRIARLRDSQHGQRIEIGAHGGCEDAVQTLSSATRPHQSLVMS